MASGTIYLENSSQTPGGGYIQGCIDWETTTNRDANTSTVTANLFLRKAIYESTVTTPTVGTWSCSLTVGGDGVSDNVYKSIAGDWILMLSKTVTVPHNADGTKTITVSGAGWGPSGTSYSGRSAEGSGTIKLEDIPRASSLSAGTLTLGWDTNSVTITAQASGFRHDVYLKVGSKSVCMLHDVLAGTHKITPTLTDFGPQLANAVNGTGTLTLYTYNAGWTAQVGSRSYTVQMTVPSSVVPSVSAVSISEAVSGIATKFGAYVQNKSKLAVAVTAAGAYGSTITRYETSIGGAVYRAQSFTSGVLTGIGNVSVTVKVTDSRGRTATVTRTVSVLAYSAPVISAISASRITADGEAADDGDRLALRLAYSISPVNNKNTRSIRISYRLASESDTTDISSGTAEWSYNGTLQYTDAPELSPDNTYVIQVVLTDYFGSTTMEAELHTSGSILDFLADGTGVAVGKAAEISNLLDVAWDLRVHGDYLDADGAAIDRIVEAGTSGIWRWRKWRSGFAECWGAQTYTGNASAAWGGLYALECAAPDYPIAFTDWPNVQRGVVCNTAAGCWLSAYGTGTAANCGPFALLRPTAMQVSASVKFYVTGHWK